MIVKSVANPSELVVCLPDEMERLVAVAKVLPLSEILRILNVLQMCLDNLSRSANKKVELEMTVIRLCNPETSVENTELEERIARLEKALKNNEVTVTKKEEKVKKPEPVVAPEGDSGKLEPMKEWKKLLESLQKKVPPLYVMLKDAKGYIGDNVVTIDSPNPMLKKLLMTDNIGAELADEVESLLGKRYRLRIAKVDTPKENAPSDALTDIIKKAQNGNVEVTLN